MTKVSQYILPKKCAKPRVEYDDSDNTVKITLQVHLPKLFQSEMMILLYLAKRKYSMGCKLPEKMKSKDGTQEFETERSLWRLLNYGLVAKTEGSSPLPRFRVTPAGYEVARCFTPEGKIYHHVPGARLDPKPAGHEPRPRPEPEPHWADPLKEIFQDG